MIWYLTALKKYAVFSGRSSRPEFWWFTLVNIALLLAIEITAFVISSVFGANSPALLVLLAIEALILLATLIPGIAVSVRRLHDIGITGWWYFLNLVPIANIVCLVWYATDGQHGPNKYGSNPNELTPPSVGTVRTA